MINVIVALALVIPIASFVIYQYVQSKKRSKEYESTFSSLECSIQDLKYRSDKTVDLKLLKECIDYSYELLKTGPWKEEQIKKELNGLYIMMVQTPFTHPAYPGWKLNGIYQAEFHRIVIGYDLAALYHEMLECVYGRINHSTAAFHDTEWEGREILEAAELKYLNFLNGKTK